MSSKKANSLHRVLEIATELFLQRRFEDVSIKEIAAAAHCSTATIYEIYGNKDNLFVEALAHHDWAWDSPQIQPARGRASLTPLLDYASARIRFLAHRRSRAALRAVSARAKKLDTVQRTVGQRQQYFANVVAEIEAGIKSKLLQPYAPDVIAYNIIAGVAFEPTIFGQIYGDDTPVFISDIIRKVFTPLVTKTGAAQLATYLGTIEEDIPATSALRPPFLS